MWTLRGKRGCSPQPDPHHDPWRGGAPAELGEGENRDVQKPLPGRRREQRLEVAQGGGHHRLRAHHAGAAGAQLRAAAGASVGLPPSLGCETCTGCLQRSCPVLTPT